MVLDYRFSTAAWAKLIILRTLPRGRVSGRKSKQRYSRSNTTLVVIATLTYRRDYTENPNAMTTPAA